MVQAINQYKETWRKWSPNSHLCANYNLDFIKEVNDMLHIGLVENNNCVDIIFNPIPYSYQYREENCTLAMLDNAIKTYGKDFIHTWSFFIIENSHYIKTLFPDTSCNMTITHYVLFTRDGNIDIISSKPPLVTLLSLPEDCQ